MSGNWKSDPEITTVFWWCMNTRGQAPWCYWWQYWWQSVSCMGLWRQGLCLRECAVWRGAVQTRRWNEGSPWLDFLLSCFILLFWKHRKGVFFIFYLPKDKAKIWPAFILFKGSLLYWEVCYHTHKGALNVSISVPLYEPELPRQHQREKWGHCKAMARNCK